VTKRTHEQKQSKPSVEQDLQIFEKLNSHNYEPPLIEPCVSRTEQKKTNRNTNHVFTLACPTESDKKPIAPNPCVQREDDSPSRDTKRRATAFALQASVCKLLWKSYHELPTCDRVPNELKIMYEQDWSSNLNFDAIIERQLSFLQDLRPEVYSEKKDEIAKVLQEEGYLENGDSISKKAVQKYLSDKGFTEKRKRGKLETCPNQISLVELWREYGTPLGDQMEAIETPQGDQVLENTSLWEEFHTQKKEMARIFHCSVEDLVQVSVIPKVVRNFYSGNSSLQCFLKEQKKVLKRYKIVKEIMDQTEKIKKFVHRVDLKRSSNVFHPELQKIYNKDQVLHKLSNAKLKRIKSLQEKFITNFRQEHIIPIRYKLTKLLRLNGVASDTKNVMSTSDIRHNFRSIQFEKWKMIQEDSLQEMLTQLESFLETYNDSMKMDECTKDEESKIHTFKKPALPTKVVNRACPSYFRPPPNDFIKKGNSNSWTIMSDSDRNLALNGENVFLNDRFLYVKR